LVEAKQIDSCWEKLSTNAGGGIRYVIDIDKSKANADFMPKEGGVFSSIGAEFAKAKEPKKFSKLAPEEQKEIC